jgi:hypothetical protein
LHWTIGCSISAHYEPGMNHSTTGNMGMPIRNHYSTNRSRPCQTQNLWSWMQPEGSDLGTGLNKRNGERTTNATIAARQDIMQRDAPQRNPTNTEKHTEPQRQHMRKNYWKASREKRNSRSRSQWRTPGADNNRQTQTTRDTIHDLQHWAIQ